MGEYEGWAQPASGLLPNGLLPNEAASVIRALDTERWMKAEERTAELIACIQPNTPSEELRNAVADYVQRLIMKCFPCQVFTFGSVPLKTYLPDGDIDLTAFSNNQSLKDTWAHQVRDMLESEEKNENAEFRVKEVQYIQAEVKIIKCLVENIVVDISFNQLGGLCTLCFLEEVDHLIDQNHLFKRSIILIKAWCYYESRILGAHHGLISTYALETLVLYIFHVFNNSFSGPLEVLYRFLEFFSKFDWENFCVSLWGPVPISSLPDVTAEPPRKDGGELLLSKLFLDACSSVYAVFPAGQENQGQPFASKHFNVIDPLRINNNLGRSVSKGNFFRIRSAFAFGAKRLARVLDCPIEDLWYEVNQFFMNTWERHGSGHRPDVPKNDLCTLELSNQDHIHDSDSSRITLNRRSKISSHRGMLVDDLQVHNFPSVQGNCPMERTRTADVSSVSRTQSQKLYGNSSIPQIYDQTRPDANSSQKPYNDKSSSQSENLMNDIHGRYLFVRTRSSPELTDNYAEVSGRLNTGKPQVTSTNIDMSMRKNTESDRTPSNSNRSSTGDSSPARQASPHHQIVDASANTVVQLNSCHSDLGLVGGRAEFTSFAGAQGMHQEEQDLVNMMASSAAHYFNGQVHVPLNIASGQLPLPISSSVLASMGYASRNFGGFFPANIPLVESPWTTTMHFSQPMVSPQLAQCFPGIGMARNAEDSPEPGLENFRPTGINPGEREHDFFHEQDESSTTSLDLDNGSFEAVKSDNKHHSASSGIPVSRGISSGTSTRAEQKFTKGTHGSMRKNHQDSFQYQDNRNNNLYVDERTRNSRPTLASSNTSMRSKTSSESSWESPSTKESKPSRDKRGRRNTSGVQATAHTKGKSVSEHSSQTDDDSRELNLQSTLGTEMAENSGCQLLSSLHVSRLETPEFEQGQTNGSGTDSLVPITPVILGSGSQQKAVDGSGFVPFAFYPTGPPVPFVTMLPLYNFPTETRPDDLSGHFDGHDGLEHNGSGPNFDISEGLEQSDVFSTSTSTGLASVEQSKQKADILKGDFASHWKNLQYGRYCQNNSRYPASSLFPSPVMVPPVYQQGHLPWDGLGRPVSANSNVLTQLMSSGPHLVPVAPLQSVSSRPTASPFQRYVDEVPRYRVGTGTYLPNPKVSVRERHPASTRRANYSQDRSDHHGDREGSWNINSKSRGTPRNHNRIHAEKPSPRSDRFMGSERRADRPWSSHRHDSFSSNQSQNSPVRADPGQSGPSSIPYGVYPLPATNPSGMSSNGPAIPSVVMLYPYDSSAVYRSPAEQLEFGSLGPVGFSGVNEVSQMSEGSQLGGVFDEQRFHGVSAQQASLDQPSSPKLRR